MSSGSQATRAELLRELAREFRQFTGLGASFFRTTAERLGLTVTDMQTFGNVGNNLLLQSPGFDPTAPFYDIEVASSASMVTITSG